MTASLSMSSDGAGVAMERDNKRAPERDEGTVFRMSSTYSLFITDTNLSNFAPLHAKIPYKKHLNLLNSPIYHQSKLPIVSSLLSFVVKHSLTDAALHELLQLISYFIPMPKLNICFTSPHTFKQ